MTKVLITPRGFDKTGRDIIDNMRKQGLDVVFNDTGVAYDHETFKSLAYDADAIIVGVDRMDADLINHCPNLKVICKFGVGTDNIDLEAAQNKNIYVGRTVGSNSRSVAEHVISLIFESSKNLYKSIHEVKDGLWLKHTGSEIENKTLGIIGFGAIGKQVAKMANGLGMNVIVYDMFEISEEILATENVSLRTLPLIFSESDYLTVHVPLTIETENMIDYKILKTMKPNACIINTARGGIVNEADLYRALNEGIIRSASFDVYSQEPPKDEDKLISLPSFILTPHTAARTLESERRTCEISSSIIMEHLGMTL